MKTNFTRIPNRLIEAIAMSRWFSERTRVFCVVLRKTYGWDKRSDRIALSQFEKLTGMGKPNVCRALRQLTAQGLIAKVGGNYKICPDFAQEAHNSSAAAIRMDNAGVINTDNVLFPNGQRALSKRTPTKETVTKETKTKEEQFQKISFRVSTGLRRRLNEIAAHKAFPEMGETARLIAGAESGDPLT